MFEVKKVKSLDNQCVSNITNFLDSYEWDSNVFSVANNDTVYVNNNRKSDGINTLRDLSETEINKFGNSELLNCLSETIEIIKNNFNPSIIWLMTYPPHTRLNFHVDDSKERHILTFNENNRFFNYEYVRKIIKINSLIYVNESYHDKEQEFNDLLKTENLNLDSFNDYFSKLDNTQIINLEKNSVYSFGDSLHNFINGSNKLRMILVFENL
jgi:hypothetical protein